MNFINRVIEYSLYAIIFLVPLVFTGDTSELFELNKMWLTWGFVIVIGVAWGSKIIIQKKLHIQKTPLDLPIMLFLASQTVSTLISLDQYVSWWGYYSRFNGGLLSTLAYIFLYYAFVSNLELKHVMRSISISLLAGICTALWGFPAHYGYDPTCLMFRGTLDTSCWTDAFKPTVRTFSTLGQPAWFAAYLALLIPIAMAGSLMYAIKKNTVKYWIFFAIAMFFYINLNFANTRAGLLAFWAGNGLFWAIVLIKQSIPRKLFVRSFLTFNIAFVACNFFFGGPLGQFYPYTLPGMQTANTSKQAAAAPNQPQTPTAASAAQATSEPVGNAGATDSAIIRQYVWQGAIEAWKANPIFGTGVETFAFAYYKYKPAGHNLTSEWDYLYNKAHNEYLNYLATTGILGLGTYLAFILLFLFLAAKWLLFQAKPEEEIDEDRFSLPLHKPLLTTGLLAGFITILITNFFGFSVVIMNLYLFLVPLFILILAKLVKEDKAYTLSFSDSRSRELNGYQWTGIIALIIVGGYLSIQLLVYRGADISYAYGNNLDKIGDYQNAYDYLHKAVEAVPAESVYKDELAINVATLSTALQQQKDLAAQADEARKTALTLSNQITTEHPNNVTYWKNRVRIFYTLAQTDPQNQGQYLSEAAVAISKAAELAPNDAKILYNLGVLYGQTGNLDKGIETLEKTIKLKPDYRDAYFALGLFYHEKAVDANGKVVNPTMQQKAIDTYQYILDKITPNDKQVQQTLDTWGN